MKSDSKVVLLDTSVWIDALRGKTSRIVEITKSLLKEERVAICGPVIFELKRGLRPQEEVLSLFEALIRLPVEEKIWDAAGEMDAFLRQRGITIPPMDILIAQVCLHYGVPLFTLDEHFRSIPKLKLFKP
ncbi:MAG: PIN domain-containing protein [Candidatus Desulfofervidaceae bacterium]|nr:PIN domain-containing protein [Candidatus Desulfofervidaceae bacterium]